MVGRLLNEHPSLASDKSPHSCLRGRRCGTVQPGDTYPLSSWPRFSRPPGGDCLRSQDLLRGVDTGPSLKTMHGRIIRCPANGGEQSTSDGACANCSVSRRATCPDLNAVLQAVCRLPPLLCYRCHVVYEQVADKHRCVLTRWSCADGNHWKRTP